MTRAVVIAGLLLAVAGCAGEPRVVRMYDGKAVEGHYVTPDGYAAYLRSVLAEENGDLKGALAQLDIVVSDDDRDPEVWARIGEVRCKLAPKDKAADDAFGRALAIDPTYAGALAAKGRCAMARGANDEAFALADRAVKADPTNVDLEALLVRADARRPNAALRERAIALTTAHGEYAASWDALLAWGRGHGDPELVARALEGLLRTAPAREPEIEKGVRELAEQGQTALARRVAAAITDAPPQFLVRGPHDPVVGRLAVDEALSRGDKAAAVRRATKAHVDPSESAARALMFDRTDIAKEMADAVLHGDPGAAGARIVLAALEAREPSALDEHTPATCAWVLAARLAAAGNLAGARTVARHAATALVGDAMLESLVVELAARGVVEDAALAPALRLELAARRREAPAATDPRALDARHELLRRALVTPRDAAALAVRLEPAMASDPIVLFAFARIAVADGSRALLERVRAALESARGDVASNALVVTARADVAKARAR